jgi:hypothetical protein
MAYQLDQCFFFALSGTRGLVVYCLSAGSVFFFFALIAQIRSGTRGLVSVWLISWISVFFLRPYRPDQIWPDIAYGLSAGSVHSAMPSDVMLEAVMSLAVHPLTVVHQQCSSCIMELWLVGMFFCACSGSMFRRKGHVSFLGKSKSVAWKPDV